MRLPPRRRRRSFSHVPLDDAPPRRRALLVRSLPPPLCVRLSVWARGDRVISRSPVLLRDERARSPRRARRGAYIPPTPPDTRRAHSVLNRFGSAPPGEWNRIEYSSGGVGVGGQKKARPRARRQS
jgi:hypothetical protein